MSNTKEHELTENQVKMLTAIEEHGGNITAASKAVNISTGTHWKWSRPQSPHYNPVYKRAFERIVGLGSFSRTGRQRQRKIDNQKRVLKALEEAEGIIKTACKIAEIGSATYSTWVLREPLFKRKSLVITNKYQKIRNEKNKEKKRIREANRRQQIVPSTDVLTDRQKLFLEAIDANEGEIKAACKTTGVTISTHQSWRYKRATKEEYIRQLDNLKSKHLGGIQERMRRNLEVALAVRNDNDRVNKKKKTKVYPRCVRASGNVYSMKILLAPDHKAAMIENLRQQVIVECLEPIPDRNKVMTKINELALISKDYSLDSVLSGILSIDAIPYAKIAQIKGEPTPKKIKTSQCRRSDGRWQ